jgi:CDP-6-deoxy-D-xylo-4-hexulose-3-dehydrase
MIAMTKKSQRWPLMKNNILREDLDAVIQLLQQEDPILTAGPNVRQFEDEWSNWLGVKHSVMVNSGSSANLLTIEALKLLHGPGGEIIVPTITWVSDIASVLHAGFTPVFVDINPRTLAMSTEEVRKHLNKNTRAVFLTHVLGFNGLTDELLQELQSRGIPLIEDVCESHGATHGEHKLGSLGWASNFSFYYAHHLSTIEGGMICTNNADLYECVRMLRAHGMVRELDSTSRKHEMADQYPDLNPDFIFAHAGFNCRSSEINAVIGRSQLKRLDANNEKRRKNFQLFLNNLDPEKYFTEFDCSGSCNYAFTLVLRQPNNHLCHHVMKSLRANHVEFRRGTSGGGNQVRQPYLQNIVPAQAWREYPNADHIHFYGFYIGNYPSLESEQVLWLCELLNAIETAD